MKFQSILVPALAGTLILGGCSTGGNNTNAPVAAQGPGGVTVAADISASTPFMASPAYTDAAVKRVGEAVMKQRPGDRFRIVPIGDRSVENSIQTFAMASSQKVHLRTVQKRMEAALTDLFAQQRRQGGNGSTNLLYGLQNSHPLCNAGSVLFVFSDGMEASSEANVGAALATGEPVKLPEPSQPFLKGGCSIWMIGIGVAAPSGNGTSVQTLPDDQLQRLTTAWRSWFLAAGASPDRVHFEAIL